MSTRTRERCLSSHHDARAGQSRGHMPCKTATARAPNILRLRRQYKRDLGNTQGVAHRHHGERPALLDRSTTKTSSSAWLSRWND
eukprot:4970658-Lingulodinium_polyedra.AAC.1